jgi:uncharacterized protein (DUF1800 family)
MARSETGVEHLLRRAGFGASQDDLKEFEGLSTNGVLQRLLDYEDLPDDVDSKIGDPAYASVNGAGTGFTPSLLIEHARQRWLFRMLHTRRPLQEKMALFWHNHFATAFTKIAGDAGLFQATKMLAMKQGELPGPQGQIELFRSMALGSFRDLLIEVAKDPAMLFWLDGRLNTRTRPQENFGREIMELFTFGIGHYNEFDVYAAARVFTGWNLRRVNGRDDPNSYYEFFYNAAQHDTTAKTFTFPIYPGDYTIPARPAASGMQDGIDLITALATHPDTARRLARKMWNFFVSEVVEPDTSTINDAANAYLQSGTSIRSLVHFMLRARQFENPGNWHTRYSWPVEFVVRAVKEVGWSGFSVDTMRAPLVSMGQTLFEPPDVNGWELGPGWFTTGGMLARMNFAATLAANQRTNLVRAVGSNGSSAEGVLDVLLDRLTPAPLDDQVRGDLLAYLEAGGAWTGSDAQLRTKVAGLARLIVGSGEYQIV